MSLTTNNERYLTSIAGGCVGYILVGGDEGLFRSTTGTANTFTQILSEPIAAIAVAPNDATKVLAAVKGVGILRSTNSGTSFALADNAAFDSTDMTAVAFHPTNANVAYAASIPDGGAAAAECGDPSTVASPGLRTRLRLTDRYVTSLAVDSAGTVYAGVLRTASERRRPGHATARATCTRAPSGRQRVDSLPDSSAWFPLHRDANTGTTIWAGCAGAGAPATEAARRSITPSPRTASPNLLYTGSTRSTSLPGGSTVALKAIKGAGVWRSTAGPNPRTWTRVSFPGADRVLSASGVGGAPSSMLMGLHAGGVWRSNDGGANWSPPTVNAGQADFAFGAFATGVNPFVSIWELSASPNNGNTIYAAAGGVGMFYTNDNPGLFRFNGTSWGGLGINAPTGAPWNGVNEAGIALNIQQVYGVSLNRASDAIAYASYLTPGGVFRRSGASWTQAIPPGATPQIRAVATSSNASKLLALPFDDKPAYTTDGGVNFIQVAVSQAGFERLRFFSASEHPQNAALWVGGTNKGVFYSIDFGNNWTRTVMGGVFVNHPIPAVAYHPTTGRIFAGDFEGNKYCSANGGANWTLLAGKLNAGITAIRAIGNSLYYLTDGAGMHREDGSC